MIVVTGATGQLGRLVIDRLLDSVPADRIVAAVRNVGKATDLAARGVQVRTADYTKPATLDSAFAGADKLLLISSNELGARGPQHAAVIDAAKRAGVELIAYTSVLHADTSPLSVADEHRETEAALAASGVPFVLLRNGWYTENYTAAIPAALEHGAVMGSAGDGRISSASRLDYAVAAANALTLENQAGRTYELAGDHAYTLTELAAEIARQAGKPVVYRDLPEADYEKALLGFGMPPPIAHLIASSDACAAEGALYDDGSQLAALIGRATTPLRASIAAALQG